jgi:hypothetical protein
MASVLLSPSADGLPTPWFELGVCQPTPAFDRLLTTLCTEVLGIAAPTAPVVEAQGLRLTVQPLTSTTTLVTLHATPPPPASDRRTAALHAAVAASLAGLAGSATHLRLPALTD